MTARERVEKLLEVARPLARRDTRLGDEARARLRLVAPLSPQGIDLALEQHLEIAPSTRDLDALLAWARPAASCSILLSANVCTAALRALACGLAVAPQVRLRPSRRDPVLAEILAREIAAAGLDVAIVAEIEPAEVVHLYGSDETLDAVAARMPREPRVRRFGAGFGVAVAQSARDAPAIARDLVAFDGAGCLSPRVVVAPTTEAEGVARALDAALTTWERVPRGPLTANDRAALRRATLTYAAIGEVFEAPHHLVAVDSAAHACHLLPPLRSAVVLGTDDPLALLEPHRAAITVVGGEGPTAEALGRICSGRRAPLGAMQRPPLDGPADLRPT